MSSWSIPLLWPGATVAVLASGPSMSQAVADRVRAAGLPTVVVNTTFRLAPWAQILYAADAAWWQHTPDARLFAGLKIACEEVQAPGVHRIEHAGNVGWSDRRDSVFSFSNSGAQAIQVAAKAGARRVLLLGMDMDGGHWHGDHPAPLRTTHRDLYPIWRDRVGMLAGFLRERGVEVINCSPASALDCWPRIALEDALAASGAGDLGAVHLVDHLHAEGGAQLADGVRA